MGLETHAFREEYRTGEAHLVYDFYAPCLRESVRYDRSVGYFRSSVFLLIGPDLISFARRGGKVRLICSPSLTAADIEAIEQGYKTKELLTEHALERDLDELLARGDLVKNTEALATLITTGILEVKIVFFPEAQGIYHEKLGIFSSNTGVSVSFKGSVNETWNGWSERGNYETLDVFCNWLEGRDKRQVERNKIYFESLWSGKINNLAVINFPQVAKNRLLKVSKSSIDEIDPLNLTDYFKVGHDMATIEESRTAPGRTNKRAPLSHQMEALEAWRKQGRRGILEHATGSGKTFTAIIALKEHLEEDGVVLVVVPDRLLHRQWEKEIKEEIDDVTILKAGDGNNRWRKNNRLKQFTQPGKGLGHRVVLTTMPTARTDEFTSSIYGGDHLFVIADEVHEIGSNENSKAMEILSGPRLGLSATPRRYSDAAGTQRILDYFGEIVQPPYTLIDAIKDGRLVEYEYHPEPIRLTAEESDEWEVATRAISREFARSKRDSSGKPITSKRLQNMLIQRSRIAKKASAKIQYAVRIIKNYYKDGESWLIYCEDQQQLGDVIKGLTLSGYKTCEYHSNMLGDAYASLEWFKNFGGIMVSIRCLDQGVDIPKISHAIILASSQNPRQFIQRRGRVLRIHKGKYKAVIYDAVVVPISLELEPGQLSLLKSELQRSIQFSKTAMNKSGGNKLISIAIDLGIDPEEVGLVETAGIEEEDQE